VNPTEMAAQLQRATKGLPGAVRAALVEVGGRGQRLLKEGFLSGQRLNVRSGRLRNSVSLLVEDSPVQLELRMGRTRGADVHYAGILEEGGVITPKRGKFLAIPVGPAVTGAGVTKGGWESPRTAPVKLRFVPTSRGGVLVTVPKRGPGKVAYVLRRSITIRARHYMRDAGAAITEAFPPVLSHRILGLFA